MLISYIKNLIKDKSVCILGFGREGKSTLNTFLTAGGFKSITICDKNPVSCREANIVTGDDYQKSLDRFDIVMKSPGIVLEDNALCDFSRLYSQTEIFLSVYRNRTIAITGTKGKSTTSSLIYHVFRECGKNAVLLGNIGIPPFDGIIKDNDTIVLELSSHQLEYTNVSPHTAVFLNIFPEHLDHYGTFEKYYDAKKNIYRYQKEDDRLIAHTMVDTKGAASHITTFGEDGNITINPSSFICDGEVITLDSSCPLLGSHNVNNIAVAYWATKPYGITKDEFSKALSTFRPLPHRLEKIGEKDSVIYYDDSISTCCETTIQALNSLTNVGTLLVGGMDRGIDYTLLEDFLLTYDIPNVIFMYDTGKRIMEELSGKEHLFTAHFAANLQEAVAVAKNVTPKGSICLLSPAAASYGFFKNFEDRGEQFKNFALG
ncbi:MAG: UDP-N-acetylmuramoyl-L-alanine--D-glutamate ligase [Clostridia bacterium]|nr:UDP-N-acetylmuramoyl-L-alanine--D-glutamate ligase [Clostridia bacterium]